MRSESLRLVVVTPMTKAPVLWKDGLSVIGVETGSGALMLPPQAKRVLSRWGCIECSEAVVAVSTNGGVDSVVGVFRYVLNRGIHAAGTWVDVKHRGIGIAEAMWGLALRRNQTGAVHVSVVSRGGRALVKKLMGMHKRNWLVSFGA